MAYNSVLSRNRVFLAYPLDLGAEIVSGSVYFRVNIP